MTEVGVSLALRRKNQLLQSETPPRRKGKRKNDASSKPTRRRTPTVDRDREPVDNPSWRLFVEVAALYTLCLILPNVVNTLGWFSWPWISNLQRLVRNFRVGDFNLSQASLAEALAPDAVPSDVAVVVLLSLSMAVVRLALVGFLVPEYDQPKRMRALVKWKSIHLLSSSYPEAVTPRSSISLQRADPEDLARIPMLPDLSLPGDDVNSDQPPAKISIKPNPNAGTESSADEKNDVFELEKAIEEMKKLSRAHRGSLIGDTSEKRHPQIGEQDDDHSDDGNGREEYSKERDFASSPAVSSGLLTSSSALSLQALLEQATPMPESRRSILSVEEAARLFAAPKCATAVFRLLFSSLSCSIALLYFRDAEFWPPAVGGNGSTKNCWDLSSVGTGVYESDSDSRNAVLRRYFLFQAAYHFHSGAFHILASLLLWFVTAKSSEKSESNVASSVFTIHNAKSLFRHSVAVGLIAGTYLFSSLRRLAAIGTFAFDASSLFLHLLQLCINAPSRRISPRWIRLLHRGLVVPIFCYSRFFVFPFVIAYSAFEESEDWLRQLESMWAPGTATYIRRVFVISFWVIMSMNFVYVRRLMFHPHVRHAVEKGRKRIQAGTLKQ